MESYISLGWSIILRALFAQKSYKMQVRALETLRNWPLSLLYSTVQRRHKIKVKYANGDYFISETAKLR